MRYVDTTISINDTLGYDGLLSEDEVVVKVDNLVEETVTARAAGFLWEGEQRVRVWIESNERLLMRPCKNAPDGV